MDRRYRVLGIAPYEGMTARMLNIAEDYPQIDLTLFTGDLDQGLAAAQANFHGDYDVVISRGATARMLQKHIALPVIEVEISMYDILCALKLAAGEGGRIALVSYADITENAQKIRDLTEYSLDLYTIDSRETVEATLRKLQTRSYQAVLCDVIVNTTANRMGMKSYLITSSANSIRQALDQAVLLCQSRDRLREENLFFRELLHGQIGETVVFDQDGHLYLSTLRDQATELLNLLRLEIPETQAAKERRIIRYLDKMMYSIRARLISSEKTTYIAFFVDARKVPLSPNQVGIRFCTRPEVEDSYYNSIFSFTSGMVASPDEISRISQSMFPVMISGEDGTGKESMAYALYLRSTKKNSPMIPISCGLLNHRSWNFLLEHHSSPLAGEGNTIYFANIDILSDERCHQLLSALSAMDVCRRNRVYFSCVCRPGECLTDAGSTFSDKLSCHSLYLPPLRSMAERIPGLLNLFLSRLNANLSRQIVGVEAEAVTLLQRFQWPHNYTQFQRVINNLAVTVSGSVITAADVREKLNRERHVGVFASHSKNAVRPLDLNRTLEEINRDIALRVVEETGGNQTLSAKRLGISRTTLWRLLK